MPATPPQRSLFTGLGETFLAVVLGNVIYYGALPYLPPMWRHDSESFRPDAGTVLDLAICAGVLGVIRLVRGMLLSKRKEGS